MAIPVVEGFAVSSDASSVSSLVVAKATGVVAGEILLMLVINERADVTTDTYNVPTGWTKLVALVSTSSSLDCSGMWYWREASGDTGDDAPTVTWTGGARCIGWYIRVSGADVTTPINIAGVFAADIGTEIIVPSITTDAANCLAFYGVTFDGGDGAPFSVAGTGWTESAEATTGGRSSGCWGTKEQAAAAATGTATVTIGGVSDGLIGVQFAINEAAGAGGGPTLLQTQNYQGMNRMSGGFRK